MTDDTRSEWSAPDSDVAIYAASEMDFERDVQRFVMEKVQGSPDSTVTCPSLTTMFLDEHVEQYGALGRWNVAAYIGVAQTIRPILRRQFGGDVEHQQIGLDLPETKLLQDRYSVPGAAGDGEPAYVPRHMLTEAQMKTIVTRDRTISAHYARRADALESWWYRNHSGSSN